MLENYYRSLEIFDRTDAGFSGVTYTSIGTFQGYIQPTSANQNYDTGKNGEQVKYRLYTSLSRDG
jgi:hypothetical protein